MDEQWAVDRLLKLTTPAIYGEDVTNVERVLVTKGFLDRADDLFDGYTENAVKMFQRSKGLKDDGVVGEKTVKALGGKWTGPKY